VFEFDLPERRTLKTAVSVGDWDLAEYYGPDYLFREHLEMCRRAHFLMLEHGVSPGLFLETDFLVWGLSPWDETPEGRTVADANVRSGVRADFLERPRAEVSGAASARRTGHRP